MIVLGLSVVVFWVVGGGLGVDLWWFQSGFVGGGGGCFFFMVWIFG